MQERRVTGSQIRAARGVLRWSVQELAKQTGIGTATIARYEEQDGIPPSRKNNLEKVRIAFEMAGIEFIGTPENAPGIRIHSRPVDQRKE